MESESGVPANPVPVENGAEPIDVQQVPGDLGGKDDEGAQGASVDTNGQGTAGETACEDVGEQNFQHVELHIVDSDEEAAELRNKLLAAPDQNIHLLACARELQVVGIVPTQMDAMAGSTPLFTYVLSTDFMGAAQDIAKSLMTNVEAGPSIGLGEENGDQSRDALLAAVGIATQADGGDVYEYNEDKPPRRKRKRVAKVKAAESATAESETEGKKKKGGRKSSIPDMKCLYCDYVSNKKYLLIRHMRCHSDERPHACTFRECPRAFKTASSLQNHMNTHTGKKPHKCKFEKCQSVFTTSGELVRHVRYMHTHEKPHKCHHENCGYDSVELSKLKRHLRSHTGERPFKCQHCDYASPDTYKLKRHLRVHTGEKPYECDICNTKFTQSNSMKAHRLIHDQNKPVFQCQLCPTKCSRKTDLRIHVQKLHQSDEPIVCAKCNKTFADRYLYNVHRKVEYGCFGKKGPARKKQKLSDEAQDEQEAGEVAKEDDSVMTETQPEAQVQEEANSSSTGYQTMRCILPDGDIVHIIHNVTDEAGSKIVTLTASQMAALRRVEGVTVEVQVQGGEIQPEAPQSEAEEPVKAGGDKLDLVEVITKDDTCQIASEELSSAIVGEASEAVATSELLVDILNNVGLQGSTLPTETACASE